MDMERVIQEAFDNGYLRGYEKGKADRPQGEWKVRGNPKRNLWECSLCRCTIYSESERDRNEFHKWCGRCGARMKGAGDETD